MAFFFLYFRDPGKEITWKHFGQYHLGSARSPVSWCWQAPAAPHPQPHPDAAWLVRAPGAHCLRGRRGQGGPSRSCAAAGSEQPKPSRKRRVEGSPSLLQDYRRLQQTAQGDGHSHRYRSVGRSLYIWSVNFVQCAKTLQWGENRLFNNWGWNSWMSTCERLKLDPIQYPI
uniref:Uncharacterized protein n=1 Tax=Molossus molossus TaxID=27622 RepID=A0A7J8C986_MOLMO|nr:hypothetical protein HJG59_010004 [Molossus molossus]